MLPLFVVTTMPPNRMRRQSTAFVTLPTSKRSNSDVVHIWLTDIDFFGYEKKTQQKYRFILGFTRTQKIYEKVAKIGEGKQRNTCIILQLHFKYLAALIIGVFFQY